MKILFALLAIAAGLAASFQATTNAGLAKSISTKATGRVNIPLARRHAVRPL